MSIGEQPVGKVAEAQIWQRVLGCANLCACPESIRLSQLYLNLGSLRALNVIVGVNFSGKSE